MKSAFHTAPVQLSPREGTKERISLCHSVPATDLRAPAFPFLVELGDSGADGEAPGENRKILEFFGDGVALDSWETAQGTAWRSRAEHYLTDPSAEPDPAKWEVDIAYLTTGT